MSCSVNLVPVARLHARSRARRQTGWVVSCVGVGVLVMAGWGLRFAVAGALHRLADDVSELDVQRSEVQRRLLGAEGRRGQLRAQLQVLAQARQPQPWARWLLTLTRDAPEGVFLTGIELNTRDSEATATKENASTAKGASAAASGAPSETSATPPKSTPALQHVRVRGYAVDHGALLQLLNTLQGLDGWKHVELVRATQEAYGSGLAVAFELDCDAGEVTP